ncbi:MAG: hypothetical protein AAFU49_24285 [Pseudomonadota bacterium]
MAVPDYSALLTEAADSEKRADEAEKEALDFYKEWRKYVDKIASDMDAERNKLPGARKKMRAQYAAWKKNATAIAQKQSELASAKKAKPVDKDRLKALERDIKAMHAQATNSRKAYNAAADQQTKARDALYAVEGLFA